MQTGEPTWDEIISVWASAATSLPLVQGPPKWLRVPTFQGRPVYMPPCWWDNRLLSEKLELLGRENPVDTWDTKPGFTETACTLHRAGTDMNLVVASYLEAQLHHRGRSGRANSLPWGGDINELSTIVERRLKDAGIPVRYSHSNIKFTMPGQKHCHAGAEYAAVMEASGLELDPRPFVKAIVTTAFVANKSLERATLVELVGPEPTPENMAKANRDAWPALRERYLEEAAVLLERAADGSQRLLELASEIRRLARPGKGDE